MSNFSPDCLVDTVGSYQDWTPADIVTTITGLQRLLNQWNQTKKLTHHIAKGNGIGTVTSKVVAYLQPGDFTTLEIETSAFGYSDDSGGVSDVGSKLTLTLSEEELKALGDFFNQIIREKKNVKAE